MLTLHMYLGEVRAGLVENRVVRVFKSLLQRQQTVHTFILIIQGETYKDSQGK